MGGGDWRGRRRSRGEFGEATSDDGLCSVLGWSLLAGSRLGQRDLCHANITGPFSDGQRAPVRDTQVGRGAAGGERTYDEEILSESVSTRRFETLLAAVFAGAALVLACLGMYGVISYSVARRTNEMGIRIALGAQASHVSMLVLRQGLRPVVGGLLVGVAAALAAGQLIGSFLFGTQAYDPAAISVVVVMLLLVAVAACWAPARRASQIDPMAALRDE